MTRYPLQAFGIGDCIFTQALAKHWIDNGDRVVWGVEPRFVQDLSRAYQEVTWLDKRILNLDYNCKTHKQYADGVIEPIRWSDTIMNVPYSQVMRAKYDMYGLDYRIWRDAMYERDWIREFELAGKLVPEAEFGRCTISDCLLPVPLCDTSYNLISPYFGSGSQYKLDIEPDNGLPNVVMSSVPGYSLFNWSLLLENATNIYAASSSILYLLELLTLKAQEIHLYARKPIEPHFRNVQYIFSRDYILHY